MEATTRVVIDARLATALTTTQPEDQSQVGEVIVVSGQAAPNTRVRVTITYVTRILVTLTRQLWQGTVNANAGGLWQTPEVGSNLGILGRADQYIVVAQSLDAAGKVIEERQVTVHK
jgi:hypothetical protein